MCLCLCLIAEAEEDFKAVDKAEITKGESREDTITDDQSPGTDYSSFQRQGMLFLNSHIIHWFY